MRLGPPQASSTAAACCTFGSSGMRINQLAVPSWHLDLIPIWLAQGGAAPHRRRGAAGLVQGKDCALQDPAPLEGEQEAGGRAGRAAQQGAFYAGPA